MNIKELPIYKAYVAFQDCNSFYREIPKCIWLLHCKQAVKQQTKKIFDWYWRDIYVFTHKCTWYNEKRISLMVLMYRLDNPKVKKNRNVTTIEKDLK